MADPVEALVLAMWQLLDDMGTDGHSVCGLAKAQARVAFEPFRVGEYAEADVTEGLMDLAEAKAMLARN